MAKCLDVLLAEINEYAPTRSKVSDGGIGDAAHATRASDHNPWVVDENGVGVVRARDFTHDPDGGLDCHELADGLERLLRAGTHPALGVDAYIIWNRRIISRNRLAEGWRAYSGTNPHTAHLHLSVTTLPGYDSTEPWEVLVALSDKDVERVVDVLLTRVLNPRKPVDEQYNVANALASAVQLERAYRRDRNQTTVPALTTEQVRAAVGAEIRKVLGSLDA